MTAVHPSLSAKRVTKYRARFASCEDLLRLERFVRPGPIEKNGQQHNVPGIREALAHLEQIALDTKPVHVENYRRTSARSFGRKNMGRGNRHRACGSKAVRGSYCLLRSTDTLVRSGISTCSLTVKHSNANFGWTVRFRRCLGHHLEGRSSCLLKRIPSAAASMEP